MARHGQTQSNVLKRYAGYSSEGLTEPGVTQMSELAARVAPLALGEIWTSEVKRAHESAGVISRILGLPVVVDHRLNEMRLGPWEGLTEEEVARQFPNEHALWCTLPDRLALPGRETLATVASRIGAVLNDARGRTSPVLLMSHVSPVRVAVLTALTLPLSLYKNVFVGNGDVVRIESDVPDARRLGEAHSLRDELTTIAKSGTSLA